MLLESILALHNIDATQAGRKNEIYIFSGSLISMKAEAMNIHQKSPHHLLS